MKVNLLNRIYVNEKLAENLTLEINDESSHYLKNVLRLKIGNKFRIFNSFNGEFLAEILSFTKKHIIIKILTFLRMEVTKLDLTLALSIIKADKMLDAMNMAVQLGVTRIIPLVSQRSQLKSINYERCSRCIIEASEQSGRIILPILENPLNLMEYLSGNQNIDQMIIYANENENFTNNILAIKALSPKLSIIIGPEGGWTDIELELLKSFSNTYSVSLGRTIMRTETAVAAAIAQIQLHKSIS